MGLPFILEGKPSLRLGLCLILAVVLHGMALYFLKVSSTADGRKAALEVVLRAAEAPSSEDFSEARRGVSITGMAAPTPRRAKPLSVLGEGVPAMSQPVREYQPAISAAQLLESARRIIRGDARNSERSGADGNELRADTVEAKLAKALRAPSAGEKRLDNYGLFKITTASGTTYCLKAPPDRMRDGPGEAISIPTTCP